MARRPVAGARHRRHEDHQRAGRRGVEGVDDGGGHRELLGAEGGEGRAGAGRRVRAVVRRQRSGRFARQRRLPRAQRQADGAVRVRVECAAGHSDDPQAAHAGLPRLQAAARQPHRSHAAQLRLRHRRGLGEEQGVFREGVARRDGLRSKSASRRKADRPWTSNSTARSSSSPAPAKASASPAPKLPARRAPKSRWSRAAAAISTPRWPGCRSRRTSRRDRRGPHARGRSGADGGRSRGATGSDRRPRQLGGCGQAHRARRPDGAGVARRDGREILQLRASARHRRQADGGARPRRDHQHHRHGRQGRQSHSPAGRRRQRGADARHGRTRRRLWAARACASTRSVPAPR